MDLTFIIIIEGNQENLSSHFFHQLLEKCAEQKKPVVHVDLQTRAVPASVLVTVMDNLVMTFGTSDLHIV